jgi:hypothetical protein
MNSNPRTPQTEPANAGGTPPLVVADHRSGRARTRLLTGEEAPDAVWQIDDWQVAVCGWSDKDFAKSYFRNGTPQADAWVRVTAPDGVTYLVLQRGYPRSSWVAARDIGYKTYSAVKAANRLSGDVPLTENVESELNAFCRRAASGSFAQAGRDRDWERAEAALRACGGLSNESVDAATNFAKAAWAFGMTVTFDEAIEAVAAVQD